MDIGAFGIDLASKFATEKRKTLKRTLTEDFLYRGAASYPVG